MKPPHIKRAPLGRITPLSETTSAAHYVCAERITFRLGGAAFCDNNSDLSPAQRITVSCRLHCKAPDRDFGRKLHDKRAACAT